MDKRLSIRPYTIVGTAGSNDAFSRVFVYQPGDAQMLATHGELYVVFSATIPGLTVDWERIAVESFDQLKSEYYAQQSGSVMHNLEQALIGARHTFAQKVQDLTAGSTLPPTDLHLGALVVWGGSFVYFASGKVYFALARNGELINMSSDRFAQESLRDHDAFVLGTTIFGERIDVALVQQILQSELSDDWQKALRDQVKDAEEGALLSGVVLSVHTEEIPDAEDVIELHMPAQAEEGLQKGSLWDKFSVLGTVVVRVKSVFSAVVIGVISRLPRKMSDEVYVKATTPTRFPRKWVLVLLLGGLLLISVYVTYRMNTKKETTLQHAARETDLLASIDRARELQRIDPVQSEQALSLIQENIGQVQGVSDLVTAKLHEAYDALYATTALSWSRYPIQELAPTVIVTSYNDTVIAVHTETGNVYSLQRDGSIEPFGQVAEFIGAQFVTAGSGGIYGYHPQSGLWFYTLANASIERILTQEGQWGAVHGLSKYQENVYVLASEKNNIWKYIGIGGGNLSRGSTYFVDPVDISSVRGFAIDGHVYVLSSSGEVEKFLGGRRTDFSLHGIYPDLQNPQQIDTGVDFAHIYIRDGESILVFDTDGLYIRRFSAPEGAMQHFSISSDESYVVAVTDRGVFSSPIE